MNRFVQHKGLMLTEKERQHFEEILPLESFYQRLDNQRAAESEILNMLQNETHSLLQTFINGGFSTVGYIAYPFWRGVSKSSKRRVDNLERLVLALEEKGHQLESNKCIKQGISSRHDLAVLLCALARDLEELKRPTVKKHKKKTCAPFDIKEFSREDRHFLGPLEDMRKYAEKHLGGHSKGLYIHGSYATRDFVKGWSDVDTTILLSKKALENPGELYKVSENIFRMRRFLCKVDPLQHHGSIIIAEHDLGRYCNTYFPLEIFPESKSLLADSELIISKRGSAKEDRAALFWFVDLFRRCDPEGRAFSGHMQEKTLLHYVALLPSLHLQALGKACYKRDSFERARGDFSERAWEAIELMSTIRREWAPYPVLPLTESVARVNPILAYHSNAAMISFFGKSRLEKEEKEALITGAKLFCEESWEEVLQRSVK